MPSPDPFAQVPALIAAGRRLEAITLAQRLGEAGHPGALFTLGGWRFLGDLLPQDFGLMRDLFQRAGEAGHAAGGHFYTNLLASGAAGPANWEGALDRLRAEAQVSTERRAVWSLLASMKLTGFGDPVAPPEGVSLSGSPDVRLFKSFFSAAECHHLIRMAEPYFSRSMIRDVASGRSFPDPVRTSDESTMHYLMEDPAVHALNRRIAAVSGTRVEQGEQLQILRYHPGQQFHRHVDADARRTNLRVLTMLIYLNTGYEGGETLFCRTGLTVKGAVGDAILFRNTQADGQIDLMSEHAGLPVTVGRKLLASRWICEHAYTPAPSA